MSTDRSLTVQCALFSVFRQTEMQYITTLSLLLIRREAILDSKVRVVAVPMSQNSNLRGHFS